MKKGIMVFAGAVCSAAFCVFGALKDANGNAVTEKTPFGDVDGETGTVGDLVRAGGAAATNEIPTKVSQLKNDSEFITPEQVEPSRIYRGLARQAEFAVDANFAKYVTWSGVTSKPTTIEGYGITNVYTKAEVDAKGYVTEAVTNGLATTAEVAAKQDAVADLATIRAGASKGATAVQPAALADYAKQAEIPTVPTKVGELENDAGYVTRTEIVPSEIYAGHAKYADHADLASVATHAGTAAEVSWINITMVPDGLDTVVPRVDALEASVDASLAAKQDRPVATVAATEISYRADGGTISVAVADGGTLSATISGWTDGQAQTAIISLASGATVSDGISLVGYGSWPTGRFIASCIRVGSRIYVTPITYLAEED